MDSSKLDTAICIECYNEIYISNCEIYLKEASAFIKYPPSPIGGSLVLYGVNNSAKFYKGTYGPAIIKIEKGDDVNLWDIESTWSH